MKLLILTQKVDKNDPVLGFFHRWIEEFARQCESVLVICLEKGEYQLPQNVTVLSLGKEVGKTKFRYIIQFYKYIFEKRNTYDSVFVHMNPEYVLLGGLFWKMLGKKVSLWYVHKSVDLKLRLAEKLVDKIFTVTKSSFQLQSNKVIELGHGIDTVYFSPFQTHVTDQKFIILSVGRITPIKKLEDLVSAIALLDQNVKEKLHVKLVGGPVTDEDREYQKKLELTLKKNNLEAVIELSGNIPYSEIREVYRNANLCVNLAPTGGIDKAVLESLSCGIPTLFRNEAFFPIVKKFASQLSFESVNDLSQKFSFFIEGGQMIEAALLHSLVVENHDIRKLIQKIQVHLSE